jgi:integrase
VARLKKPGRHSDGRNLFLQIMPGSGIKSWIFRYARGGKERAMGLGPVHTVSLQEARERARKCRLLLLDGIDPVSARQAERAAKALEEAKRITFQQAATEYCVQHEAKWRNAKTPAQFLSSLKSYVFPKIGALPVAAIDTGLVLKCIEPIWQTKTETANRTRSRIESVLDWAAVRGYRVGDNPARWKGHLSEVLPARKQIQKPQALAAVPFTEVPALMSQLRQQPGVPSSALAFLILTAARSGEVIGARWEEINLADRVWTIPAERMKSGRQHRVPLSDAAM